MKNAKNSNILLICGAIILLIIGIIIGFSINKKEAYTKVGEVSSIKDTTSNNEIEPTDSEIDVNEEQDNETNEPDDPLDVILPSDKPENNPGSSSESSESSSSSNPNENQSQ